MLGFLLFLVGITAFFAIQVYIFSISKSEIKTLDKLGKADAVMILGALVYSDGSPAPILKDRLDKGFEVYEAKLADKIIVSGDHGRKEYDEVGAMKQYLLEKGVPEADIFMDHAGFDTYDSIYRARDIFQVESLIISTQEYHLPRSVYIAKKLGIKAQGYPSQDPNYKKTYNSFRESLARVKAFVDVQLFKSKPKFLGDVIPITESGLLTESNI